MQILKEGQYPALVKVARDRLGRDIQKGDEGHSPVSRTFSSSFRCIVKWLSLSCPIDLCEKQVEDAKAALDVYLVHREAWEEALVEGKDVTSAIPNHYVDWYF
jgi:hypothetical protein